jgi:hypothetical protein
MPGISAATGPEWSLLLAACSSGHRKERLETLLQSSLRWDAVFDLADRHGVEHLLYQALSDFKALIPPEHFNSLSRKCQTNVHKSLMLSRELIRIVNELSAAGIEVMPYKGLALAEALYGDIALRQSGDIDLLIRAVDLARVREALTNLGFTQQLRWSPAEERSYLKSGYECVFDGAAGRNLLEVQWAIQPRFYAVDFDMEQLFRRSVVVSVAGRPTKTPSLEDLFIILSLHAAKHVWGRLIWICDLARIIGNATLDWNQIGTTAKNLGIERILRIALLLANRLLETPIPPPADTSISQDQAATQIANEVETYIQGDRTFDVESVAYFRLMLRLRERWQDRMRFASRLLFTAGPSEWKAVRLPEPLFPLYRIVRMTRLAAKLVRT